jgi:hypothetical protein
MPESTWNHVRTAALSMPDAEETISRGNPSWRVHGKAFVWESPLRDKDLAELGLDAQPGPVLGARVDDEPTKFALVNDDPTVFFTTSHFNGYPAVLVWLDNVSLRVLGEIVADAWISVAPQRLVSAWLQEHPD